MKRYKFNNNANVGNVLFIVEGAETEFDLIEIIFTKKLGYQLVKKVRNNTGYILVGKDTSQKVYALNYKKNQLHKIDFNELDSIYRDLRNNYAFDPSQAVVYYIYDRDVQCYNPHGIDIKKDYLEKFTDSIPPDPSVASSGYEALLLLSYPSVESYLTSCFIKDSYKPEFECELGKTLKVFNANRKPTIEWAKLQNGKHTFEKDWIVIAAEEMDKSLISLGIDNYDIDNFCETNIQVFDKQEFKYKQDNKFTLLSLLSIALLQLGIIEEITDFDPSQPRKSK